MESKTGAAQDELGTAPVLCYVQGIRLWDRLGQRLYRSTGRDHEQHGRLYRRTHWTDGM